MNKFKYKIYQFMQGRYGNDNLNNFLYIIIFILLIISFIFVRNNYILNLIIWLLLVYTLFRAYSRKIYARSNENAKFLKLVRPITKRFRLAKRQAKDSNNKYFICPECGQNIRVPKGKGKITITCPKCRCKFDKRT